MFCGNLDWLCAMPNYVVMGGEFVVVVLFGLLVVSGCDLLLIERNRLLADRLEIDGLTYGAAFIDKTLGCLADVRVECASEAFVTRNYDDQDILLWPFYQQRVQNLTRPPRCRDRSGAPSIPARWSASEHTDGTASHGPARGAV